MHQVWACCWKLCHRLMLGARLCCRPVAEHSPRCRCMKLLVLGVSKASVRQLSSLGEPGISRCVSHTDALDTTALLAMIASGMSLARGVAGDSFTPAALPPDLRSSLRQSTLETGQGASSCRGATRSGASQLAITASPWLVASQETAAMLAGRLAAWPVQESISWTAQAARLQLHSSSAPKTC